MRRRQEQFIPLGVVCAAICLLVSPAAWGDSAKSRWSGAMTINQLEWQYSSHADSVAWDVSGWIGTADNRLWILDEGGTHVDGAARDNRLELLWGHPMERWELLVGVRYDSGSTASRTYAALGFQAMAPLGIKVETTGYIGDGSRLGDDVHVGYRIQAERDWRLSSLLTLRGRAEYELWSEDHVRYGEGIGPSGAQAGLRLHYAFGDDAAPYIGVEWFRLAGDTADLARQFGETTSETRLVVGLRLRF